MELYDTLKRYGFDDRNFSEVEDAFVPITFQAGQPLFQEGEPANSLYFIRSGRAIATVRTPGGLDDPIGIIEEGEFCGELGILEGLNRTETIRAIGDVQVFRLDKDRSLDLMERSSTFSNLIRTVSITRTLKNTNLFKGLDDSTLNAIRSIVIEKETPGKSSLFQEGDLPDALYIIVKGSVRVIKPISHSKTKTPNTMHITVKGNTKIIRPNTRKKEITVAYLSEGDLFGRPGLLESFPRSASVETAEPCKFLVMPRSSLLNLIKDHPKIAFNWYKIPKSAIPTPERKRTLRGEFSVFQGMIIVSNEEKCVYCKACELACAVSKSKSHHLHEAIFERPIPIKRINKLRTQTGDGHFKGQPGQCRTCYDAPCLISCRKFKAIKRDPFSRAVVIVEENCVGCNLCAKACPNDVISIIRHDGKKRRIALKCTLCEELTTGPACVRSCPTNALTIGLAPLSLT